MRPNKPWFGPIPSIGKAACPISWEGYAITIALILGMAFLRLEPDLARRSIALALIVAAYGAIVWLTWGDPDGAVARRSLRDIWWNRYTLVWLGVLLLFVGACLAAGLTACTACIHKPWP